MGWGTPKICSLARSPEVLRKLRGIDRYGPSRKFCESDSLPLVDRGGSIMATLAVMYKTPKDAAAFDKHYSETHIPLAKKIPGLRKYEVSKGPVATPAGPSGYHFVALLHYDDVAAIQNAFASAEGKAAVADVANFATGGVDIIMFDTREVGLDGAPHQAFTR